MKCTLIRVNLIPEHLNSLKPNADPFHRSLNHFTTFQLLLCVHIWVEQNIYQMNSGELAKWIKPNMDRAIMERRDASNFRGVFL